MHCLEEAQQPGLLQHRAGERSRLVRDHDQRACLRELGDGRFDAVEHGAAGHRRAQGGGVETTSKPRRELVVVDGRQRGSREGTRDQRIWAIADPAAHRVQRESRQARLGQRRVQRVRDAAGAVDQRAVEIERDRVEALHRRPASAPSRSAAIARR